MFNLCKQFDRPPGGSVESDIYIYPVAAGATARLSSEVYFPGHDMIVVIIATYVLVGI